MRLKFSYDFRHTAINQLWKLVSGPVILVLIPLYLSTEVQGYWYTFVSLAALAVFADMGFSTILLQFSAHEFAHLKFEKDNTLSGNEYYLQRISTLFRFSMLWSSSLGAIIFPIILVFGFFIINEKQTEVSWVIPWVIYGIASVFVFINSMLLSFIEGCNRVGEVQKIRFYISVLTVVSTIIFLMSDFELYALAVSLSVGAISGTLITFFKYRNMLEQLLRNSKNVVHTWKQKILPLIGKYALSWISGYFILFVFTPIAFHFIGAVEAGEVGFTIAVCTAIFGISNIWMIMITPKVNMYVAHKNYRDLNVLFRKHLGLSIVTYILGIILLFLIVMVFGKFLPFTERLVSHFSLLIVSLGWLLQLIVNGLAIYMRAHKEEPLVLQAFVTGVYVTGITILISIYLPYEFFFIGFLSSYIWGLPWVIYIFRRYKKR